MSRRILRSRIIEWLQLAKEDGNAWQSFIEIKQAAECKIHELNEALEYLEKTDIIKYKGENMNDSKWRII